MIIFLSRFVTETKKLAVGAKTEELTDVGPMISEKEAKRVHQWIEEARQLGATFAAVQNGRERS